MKITLSHYEVNEILIAWVKTHLRDIPENAEFAVSSSAYSYSDTTISITEPDPASAPSVEPQEIA
jgi:hypothetical protein